MKLQIYRVYIAIFLILCFQSGCKSPSDYRVETDKTAYGIISEIQEQATGRADKFNIERPSDILRRKLLAGQNLPRSSAASLGTDKLGRIEHWPQDDYPKTNLSSGPVVSAEPNRCVRLTLLQALQVGARNNFNYQDQKEDVFRSALALELERDEFRNTFAAQVKDLISTDTTGQTSESGTVASGQSSVNRKFETGGQLTTALAVDIANLLTAGGVSSLGLAADATVSIPLLRGSAGYIVTEPLRQAERDVVYAIWEFERFKKQYAVDVAGNYLSVLRQMDAVRNSEEDYRKRIASARRSRRLADAGRLKEIEVDQTLQDQLRARARWISATERYKKQLDTFKKLLGLPADANIELDPNELEVLAAPSLEIINRIAEEQRSQPAGERPPADAPINLPEPGNENAGPLEMDESEAIKLAFENRLDLKLSEGRVYDAQRAAVVAADALGAELTFFGSAEVGARRTVATADLANAQLRTDRGVYSAFLTLDLPFERTKEAVNYRSSFIDLEKAVRNVQSLEDQIKLDVRDELRQMLEARENLYIQAQAVFVAQKRVRSVNLFLEAGRAAMRDLLEAQDALLSARNNLTSAVVDYRIAELKMQRDTGVLQVDENGLWKEYSAETQNDV